MIELNLTTSNKEQELIKQYLQENVSETLANKINNGVKIVKDNKTLINKKGLNGFMNYASSEARKLAEKGSNCACIEDKVVFGWAIHYFEEDEIVGTLFNEEGAEYNPVTKKTETPKVEVKQQPKKPEKQQTTLFDLMSFDSAQNEENNEETEPTNEELNEPPIEYEVEETDNNIDEFSEKEIDAELDNVANEIVNDNNIQINTQTGEVLSDLKTETPTIDKDYMKMLYTILDGKITIK